MRVVKKFPKPIEIAQKLKEQGLTRYVPKPEFTFEGDYVTVNWIYPKHPRKELIEAVKKYLESMGYEVVENGP